MLDDTGAVFLAGSEPVKLFPLRQWTGLLLGGLVSRPLWMEPVDAWLVDGILYIKDADAFQDGTILEVW